MWTQWVEVRELVNFLNSAHSKGSDLRVTDHTSIADFVFGFMRVLFVKVASTRP
jgi:hypothetical protein